MGDIVNIAVRLQTAAPAGPLVVSDPTERAARRAIEFDSIGELSVRAKAPPVAGWRAIRVVALMGGELRADPREAPIVGRERELRLLKELLHATALDRRARLVSIVGLAGVGKSRLVWELEKYMDLLLDSSLTWAELALLTPNVDTAKNTDRRARGGFSAWGPKDY